MEIQDLALREDISQIVQSLLGDIEWAVPSIDLETDVTFATELVDLKRLLSRWKLSWSETWASESKRQEIARLAQQWCDRLRRVA